MLTMPLTLIAAAGAALWDGFTGRIPNLITLPAVAVGLLINIYAAGFSGFLHFLAGTGVGLALLLIPFVLGGMGGGDVKLLAAVGALNGPYFVFSSFIFAAMAGGAMAMIIVLAKKQFLPVFFSISGAFSGMFLHILKRGGSDAKPSFTSGIRFPYGLAIFIGTAAAYWVRW